MQLNHRYRLIIPTGSEAIFTILFKSEDILLLNN